MASVDFGRYKRIVQYFWDPEPKNDDPLRSPIWCLGKEYMCNPGSCESSNLQENRTPPTEVPKSDNETVIISADVTINGKPQSCDANGGTMTHPGSDGDRIWPCDFLDDFESRFWFTYRSHFQPIKKSLDTTANHSMSLSVRLRGQLIDQAGFTSDTGWGCMIRSGQCLLANALGILRFGRAWRRGARQQDERELLALFADDPKAPYSIHNFVEHGAAACDKHPGEWFGPSATARCIQALSEGQQDDGLKVYIAGDGADVYEDTFLKLARAEKGVFHPVLILLGIRLGIDRVTPVYWEALKSSLQLPQAVGIAGGRPSSSHYFSGVQGDYFFYHDPHQTRPALLWHEIHDEYTVEEIDSCHTRRLRRLHTKDMDPSMLVAFLIRDQTDWQKWRQAVGETKGKPIIHVADSEPAYQGHPAERADAVVEVQSFDDEGNEEGNEEDEARAIDDGDGELVDLPL
ncbi:Cysteine protease atg4 [Xylographa opegraphella]|nr:Cysteine protease atg4 [Xylographa opegraphella]